MQRRRDPSLASLVRDHTTRPEDKRYNPNWFCSQVFTYIRANPPKFRNKLPISSI